MSLGSDEVGEAQEQREARRELFDADRLIVFTDAVVAIALTLLVFPLLQSVPGLKHHPPTTGQWLHQHAGQLGAFTVSFAIVATSWVIHNRIWSHVDKQTAPMVALNFVWMLSIVFLQIPTALVYSIPHDRLLLALYIGTMTAGSLTLTAIAWVVYRHPECQDRDDPLPRSALVSSVAASGVYVACFVVGVTFAPVTYWALALTVLIGPVRALALRLSGETPRALRRSPVAGRSGT